MSVVAGDISFSGKHIYILCVEMNSEMLLHNSCVQELSYGVFSHSTVCNS